MNYALHLLVYFDIYLMIALSLNLVFGYCGMLTLAHAAYVAIGGYVYALVVLNFGLGFPFALLLAVAVGAVASVAISVPGWVLKGDLFALATIAVGMVLVGAMTNWNDLDAPIGSWRNLTNGPYGISGIAKPTFLGLTVRTPAGFAVLATGGAVIVALLLGQLQQSPWGRLLVSMRDDELATRSLGKRTRALKVQAFAISCGVAAGAGAVLASYLGFLEPGSATFNESILMLSVVIIGGSGNVRGPVTGALIVTVLPEVIRSFGFPDAFAANIRLALYGALLVLLMHIRPQGLLGQYRIS